jgi:hypothetical protein
LKYVTFCLKVTYYIYSTLYQFNNCWVRIVYQVTIHKCQSVLHLNVRMGASDYGLSHTFTGLETVANGLTDKKALVIISSFWVGAEYTWGGGSKCPHKQKCNGLRSDERGLYLEYSVVRVCILLSTPFLIFVWGTREVCPSLLDNTTYWNAVSSVDLTASNCRMISKQWIGKQDEGSSHDPFGGTVPWFAWKSYKPISLVSIECFLVKNSNR